MRFYIGAALWLAGAFIAIQLGIAGHTFWAAASAVAAIGGLAVCILEIAKKSKGK